MAASLIMNLSLLHSHRQCLPIDTVALLPNGVLPRRTLLPRWSTEHLGVNDQHLIKRLHGKCLILLGDSTTAETAHDLAIIMGAPFERYVYSATRMNYSSPNRTIQTNESGTPLIARFFPSHRNFTVQSASPWDAVVFHRFIGHYSLYGNYQGIRALGHAEIRREIEHDAASACGNRSREVWLNSGAHDPEARPEETHAAHLGTSFSVAARSALIWAETLAPMRLWLSRHSSAPHNQHCARRDYECRGSIFHLEAIEAWWRQEVQPRPGWKYIDHHDAWACEQAAESDVPLHTGAIALYHDTSYCCYHLSILRTLCALVPACWRNALKGNASRTSAQHTALHGNAQTAHAGWTTNYS